MDSLAEMVETALRSQRHRIDTATEYLFGQRAAGRFNTERAIEVYRIAIDNAVWEELKGSPLRRQIYRGYKSGHYAVALATELARQFKEAHGASDQRQERRWFRSLLGS